MCQKMAALRTAAFEISAKIGGGVRLHTPGPVRINAFTFLEVAMTPTQFWPLGALLRTDWKENELAVIDCRPIIGVTTH